MTDTTGPLVKSLRKAFQELDLPDSDAAAKELALQYADAIDHTNCWECGSNYQVLNDLGPKLVQLLNQLGATPAARDKLHAAAARGSAAKPTAGNVVNLDSLRNAARPS